MIAKLMVIFTIVVDLKYHSFIPYRHEEEIDLQSILVQEEGYNLISLGNKEYYEFLNNFLSLPEKDEYFKKMGILLMI